MKTIAAVLMLCASTVAFADEVVSVGYGATEPAAVENAKHEAANRVAGEFIASRTHERNGEINEQVIQYSGGFIRTYKMLSSTFKNGMYEVVINADVDADKVNAVADSQSAEVSENMTASVTNAYQSVEKVKEAMSQLRSGNIDDGIFVNTVKSVSYDVDGEVTHVRISYTIRLNPKWIDDVKTLVKAANKPTGFPVCFEKADRSVFDYLTLSGLDCYNMPVRVTMPAGLNIHVYALTPYGQKMLSNFGEWNTRTLYLMTPDIFTFHEKAVLEGVWKFDVASSELLDVHGFQITE